jgi:hypothetical protein
MDPISLTPDMLAKLAGVTERRELRDETGKLIGYFDPPATGGWGAFTAEEVAQALKRTGPARTLDEIYKEFGHL